jgi:hypothetical protein
VNNSILTTIYCGYALYIIQYLGSPAIGLTIETIGACLVGFSHSFEAESGVKSKERTLPVGPREKKQLRVEGAKQRFCACNIT